jgi:phosphatidylglycerol:prolipoprotein diacylglycerol transferase
MNIDINPVLLSLGPIEIRWYGLMYVVGYFIGSKILLQLSKNGFMNLTKEGIDKYITYLIIGMFIGARSFYVFIYNWDYYSNNLDELLAVWKGGLSFHGALCGMIVASYIIAKKYNLNFFVMGDSMAVAGTQGLFFGRVGNFMNGELYGRITDSPIGIVFKDGGPYPRHASQLYEGLLEGLLLWIIIWFVHKRQKHYGVCSAIFLAGYGLFRYIVEFYREPDAQLGYYFGGTTTMGQILCLLMIPFAVGIYFYTKKLNLKNPLLK